MDYLVSFDFSGGEGKRRRVTVKKLIKDHLGLDPISEDEKGIHYETDRFENVSIMAHYSLALAYGGSWKMKE